MRAVLLLVFGLIIGAVGASMVGNALRLRHAYTRGVMDVMQHHAAALHNAARNGKCPGTATLRHLGVMSTMAGEIGPAFANGGDAHFNDLAQRLRDTLHAARQSPAPDCKSLLKLTRHIGDNCDACHREYR